MIQALDHLVLTVRDPEATCRFYSDVLGMRRVAFHPSDGTTRLALEFGAQKINLHQAGAEFIPKSAVPTPGSADLCFLLAVDLKTCRTRLEASGVPIEQGPVARTGAQGPLTSLYIRDPDQNLIELSVPAA